MASKNARGAWAQPAGDSPGRASAARPPDAPHRLARSLEPVGRERQRLAVVAGGEVAAAAARGPMSSSTSASPRMLPTDFAIFSPSDASSIPLCIHRRANSRPRPASVCAASFSWCGNTRSIPPPWMSNSSRAVPRPSPSTRCASRAARAPTASPRPCPRPPSSPSRARSRADPPSGRAASTPSPWSICSTSRRESPPYDGSDRTRKYTSPPAAYAWSPSTSAPDQVEDRVDVLRGQRLVVGPPEPEPLGVVDVVRGHLARELRRVARPPPARRRRSCR